MRSLGPEICDFLRAWEEKLDRSEPLPTVTEIGTVLSVREGIATVSGLSGLGMEELVRFSGGQLGFCLTLEPSQAGIALLDSGEGVRAGSPVERLGHDLRVCVGDTLLGRVLDGAGRPIDGKAALTGTRHRSAESRPPSILERAPVTEPLQTGLKVVDAMVPLGKGQRELIVGERHLGKTSLALDAIAYQAAQGLACVYCAIGQRDSGVTRVLSEFERLGVADQVCTVVARAEEPSGIQFMAPYTATAIAEDFMRRGQDALIVYDDLSSHAIAYRELSLLLRRPPGREAFPGDVFYLHSRLLERATRLKPEHGGGSLTALPICTLDSESLTSFIPTNLISITDGQLVLSSQLFQKGQIPAVDVGRSVSRVGGHAQLKAYREFLADLRLEYAQFEELEAFARFDTRLSAQTLAVLERGRRIRAVLTQAQFDPFSPAEQIAVLQAATQGLLDKLELSQVSSWQRRLRGVLARSGGWVSETVKSGSTLSVEQKKELSRLIEGSLLSDEETPSA